MSITSILNTKTGEEMLVIDIFTQEYIEIVDIRRKCKESIINNKPEYVCFMCNQQVYLKGKNKTKKLHFAHKPNSEYCIWKSDNEHINIEQQRKMFHKVKESELHKSLKNFIGEMLEKDKNFKDIYIEKRYLDKENESYKVPDVRATLINKNIDIVFEIQLTNTFLDVIIERENFYYENGVIVIWIFANFSKDLSKTRMTEDDILSSNKKNVFILDNESILKSKEENQLYIKNIHLIPTFDFKTGIINNWSEPIILPINHINFDVISGKSYIYNYEYQRTRILYEQKLKDKKFKNFYNSVLDKLKIPALNNAKPFKQLIYEDDDFIKFNNVNIIEQLIDAEQIIRYVLFIIFQKKKDIVYCNSFLSKQIEGNQLIQILNHIINIKKDIFPLILKTIDYYGLSEEVINSDKKGTFRKKINQFKTIEINYSNKHFPIVQKLFPELFYRIDIPKFRIN